MPGYADGFLLPIRKRDVPAYRRLSRRAGKVWREHGALDYKECVGDDLKPKGVVPFPRLLRCRRGETVIFAWIVFRSRAHRDRVNARVMADPRIVRMAREPVPFDTKRMHFGGFSVIVDC